MPINTIVPDPERILDIEELDSIISRIITYQKEKNCNSGVLEIQRRQFGASYRIRCEKEADDAITNPGKCEWGIQFYPLSYFQALRTQYAH